MLWVPENSQRSQSLRGCWCDELYCFKWTTEQDIVHCRLWHHWRHLQVRHNQDPDKNLESFVQSQSVQACSCYSGTPACRFQRPGDWKVTKETFSDRNDSPPRQATAKLNEELLNHSSPTFEVKLMDGKESFYERLLSDAIIKQQLGGSNIPEPLGSIKSKIKLFDHISSYMHKLCPQSTKS